MSNGDEKTRKFELDISQMGDMQELIFEYFCIIEELLKDRNFDLQKIELDIDSNKILAIGWDIDEDSEDETDPDFEWI